MCLLDNNISLIIFTGREDPVIHEDPISGRKKSGTLQEPHLKCSELKVVISLWLRFRQYAQI